MSHWDVVVVGAGPAGWITALTLAAQGYRIGLVERRAKGQCSDRRYFALNYGTVVYLQALQVLPANMVSFAMPLLGLTVQHGGQKFRLSATELNLPALGWSMHASALQSALEQAGERANGIEVHWNSQLELEALTPSGIKMRLNEQAVQAQLCIVADGGQSDWAKALGFLNDLSPVHYMGWMTRIKWPQSLQAYQWLNPHEALGFVPQNEQGGFLIWSALEASVREPLVWDSLQMRFGVCFEAQDTLLPYRLTLQRQGSVRGYRCLLMGNAAGAWPPIAAQGLNMTVRDIVLLGKILSAGPEFAGERQLNIYERERQLSVSKMGALLDLAVHAEPGTWKSSLTAVGVWGLARWRSMRHIFGSYFCNVALAESLGKQF